MCVAYVSWDYAAEDGTSGTVRRASDHEEMADRREWDARLGSAAARNVLGRLVHIPEPEGIPVTLRAALDAHRSGHGRV